MQLLIFLINYIKTNKRAQCYSNMAVGKFPMGSYDVIKAIFHCSRFARAGGADIAQLSLQLSILCIFCPPECSRTRHESRTTFNFLNVPARLIFHVIKIVRSTRAGKAWAKRLQWKMALTSPTLLVGSGALSTALENPSECHLALQGS
jgi:hypothetical protein